MSLLSYFAGSRYTRSPESLNSNNEIFIGRTSNINIKLAAVQNANVNYIHVETPQAENDNINDY